jgi:hypothetical protein
VAECANVALPLLARAKMNELFFFFEHPTFWFVDRSRHPLLRFVYRLTFSATCTFTAFITFEP